MHIVFNCLIIISNEFQSFNFRNVYLIIMEKYQFDLQKTDHKKNSIQP